MSAAARCVLITGCSTGIGYVACHQLRQQGFRVFATARQAADVARLRDEGFESWLLDTTDHASIAQAIDGILSACDGRLYAVFHNAGYGQPGAVEDVPTTALRAQFEGNVFGAHEINRRVLPQMRQHGEGRIIWNSSILGFWALPFRGAYNASKFAIEGLADTLRLELHGSGIHVSVIQPGPITSRFRANALQHLLSEIDIDQSAHASHYHAVLSRLQKSGDASRFTLGPEAVVDALLDALNHPRPKPRYRVTAPTRWMAILKPLLPTRWLDSIARRNG